MAGHGHDHAADRWRLVGALALIAGLLVAEVAVGIVAGSLALLADAGHMLTDAAALALALVAAGVAARPAGGSWTFGFRRVEILAALANGITLALVGIWTLFTAAGMLEHWWIVLVAGGVGSVIGVLGARRVPMTAMPQMVAIFNGAGGGAAAVVALSEFLVSVKDLPPGAPLLPVVPMIATLLGLILMLGSLSKPDTVGPSMAIALIGTLYGALLANLICIPLGEKLGYMSHEDTVRCIELMGKEVLPALREA